MSREPRFIHLRVHSEHSLLEGAVRIRALAPLCRAARMPAVALTDTNNLFGALEFSETMAKAGIQPIVGCQVDVAEPPTRPGDRAARPAPVVLLAQNEAGYRNLLALNSCMYLDPERMRPHVTPAEIEARAEGLICLSGGPEGPVGRLAAQAQAGAARALLSRLSAAFPGRLYVELQRHGSAGTRPEAERASEALLVELADELSLPLVATNDVHFPDPEMFEAHDAMLCIAGGAYVDQAAPRRRLTPDHHFRGPEEMAALFADLPEAVENTVEIARRCAFRPRTRDPILPRFAEDEAEALRAQAEAGLEARLAAHPPAAAREAYETRLAHELDVIEGMGFPGYFLIVADFIKWAKTHEIPVGPGRGSGAGSLVAYALTITDLDPLRYGLLFERFLNPERVSMPDFDIDFCMDRREEVISYVQSTYGADRVAQIITFGALLSKAAVRDVGRVLQLPYGQVDRLAKLIPVEGVKPVPVAQALKDEPRLAEEARREEVVGRLLDYAGRIEGLLRNASTHAAGVVIGDRPLDELVPLYRDQRSDMPATQFNMKWVEQAGLVKFDFLGLKTLTVIQNAVEMIRATGVEIDISTIPLDDGATFRVYAEARTVGVFQVESAGMMDALRRMKPTCIEDIVALVALYRPGPMENIPKFCEVKNGLRERESIHPSIDHILDETQGIIVYQEQVMQIAQDMAGYTLGGADLLRRAMGKKIQSAMDAERPKFIAGAKQRGVDDDKALEVWHLLEKFANYGFNKSHAAAYALVSYQTAWLKANHPAEYMAAVMNADIHLTDKLATYAEEVRRRLKITIEAPCVNRSQARFSVEDGRILYGLGALKNVGIEAMGLIVAARGDRPFDGLFDLARRVDLRRIGKRALEMLARAGAFDALEANRRRAFEAIEALTAYSAAIHEAAATGQDSLFGAAAPLPEPRLPEPADWPPEERLTEEHSGVGFFLSGHPLDEEMPLLRRRQVMSLAEVAARAEQGPFLARLVGAVAGRRERKSGKGTRYAFVQLSDPTGGYEVTLFSEALEAARPHLEPGVKVIVTAEATREGDQLKLIGRQVQPLAPILAEAGNAGVCVRVETDGAVAAVARLLDEARAGAGVSRGGEVTLRLAAPDLPGEVEVVLPGRYPVGPAEARALKSLPGVAGVEIL